MQQLTVTPAKPSPVDGRVLPPLRIGPLTIDTPVVLAPMAGVTNAAFRRLCRESGAGLYVAEMVTSRALVERGEESMRIIAHDPFISADLAAALGVELVSLDQLCARADYISLHLPALPSTRHLFNAERLARCKQGVRIVNTARGELIDEQALADAIERGHVAGAGLDVFSSEPLKDWRLAGLPQVVATPHIAASTREAQEQVGSETAAAPSVL